MMVNGFLYRGVCAVCLLYAVTNGDSWYTSGSGKITTSNSTTNVGIGMASGGNPGARLEVAGGDILISNNRYFNARNSNGTSYSILGLNGGNVLCLGSGNGVAAQNFFTAGTSRMYIGDNGYVGINTASPSHRLDVKGDIIVRGNNWNSGEDAVINLGDDNHYIKSIWGEGIRIGTYQAPDVITIKQSSGAIGIGTTATDANFRMTVSGQGAFYSDNTNDYPILRARYTNTAAAPNMGKAAIEGSCYRNAGFGIGGAFFGGYMGLSAIADLPGEKTRYGLSTVARQGSGPSTLNCGVLGFAESGESAFAYGVYGWASSVGGIGGASAYGIIGRIPDPKDPDRGPDDWAGYFLGRIYTTEAYFPSDDKLKKNISGMENALEKVTKLQPVSFDFDYENHPNLGLSTKKQLGLLAQDVEAQFPELVSEFKPLQDPEASPSAKSRDVSKYKGVNYIALIPVLIKAIQEQQEEINRLKARVEALQ